MLQHDVTLREPALQFEGEPSKKSKITATIKQKRVALARVLVESAKAKATKSGPGRPSYARTKKISSSGW